VPEYIILHDTAISIHKYAEQLSIVDKYHTNKWGHIAYHYFVGTDGTVKNPLPVKRAGYSTWCTKTDNFPSCKDNPDWLNHHSIAIVLAGRFSDGSNHTVKEYPSKAQFESFKLLVLALQREYHIADDHIILHADSAATTCPGIDLHPRNWKNLEKLI